MSLQLWKVIEVFERKFHILAEVNRRLGLVGGGRLVVGLEFEPGIAARVVQGRLQLVVLLRILPVGLELGHLRLTCHGDAGADGERRARALQIGPRHLCV